MYYLDNPEKCIFCRHEINIELSAFQKIIRKSEIVCDYDIVIVQAFWEICGDYQEYGPFKITREATSRQLLYRLYYDQLLVLEVQKTDGIVIISYIRTNKYVWIEELCEIANAHAELVANYN